MAAPALLALGACATTSTPTAAPAVATTAAAPAAGDEQVCVREFPVGSTIAVTRCRSKEQVAADRAAANATAGAIRDNPRVTREPTSSTGR